MAKRNKGNGRQPPLYRSYMFRTKDPVIDQLRTMAEDTYGMRVCGKSLQMIEDAGGPTVGCMRGWFFGTTKRPQNPTAEAAGRSMGYQRTWVRIKGKD